jgi:hypothetical protein
MLLVKMRSLYCIFDKYWIILEILSCFYQIVYKLKFCFFTKFA